MGQFQGSVAKSVIARGGKFVGFPQEVTNLSWGDVRCEWNWVLCRSLRGTSCSRGGWEKCLMELVTFSLKVGQGIDVGYGSRR